MQMQILFKSISNTFSNASNFILLAYINILNVKIVTQINTVGMSYNKLIVSTVGIMS